MEIEKIWSEREQKTWRARCHSGHHGLLSREEGFTRALSHLEGGVFPTSASPAFPSHLRRKMNLRNICQSHSPGAQPPSERLGGHHEITEPFHPRP